jgi:hypothetical protein
MADVRRVDGVDGVLFQITLTANEVQSIDRGDIVELSDPDIGPSSRNWIRVRLSKRIDDI